MEINKQVCSIEQSKKLKELGVIQDSIFYHFPDVNTKEIKKKYKLHDYNIVIGKKQIGKEYETIRDLVLKGSYKLTFSAFTVAELGVMLPEYYPSWRFRFKKAKMDFNSNYKGFS